MEQRPWIAEVEREIAGLDDADRQVAEVLRAHREQRHQRAGSGASVVYSIRLDPAEVKALECRAAATGIRPTVLARNLIRTGLCAGRSDALSEALRRVEDAVAELRALAS